MSASARAVALPLPRAEVLRALFEVLTHEVGVRPPVSLLARATADAVSSAEALPGTLPTTTRPTWPEQLQDMGAALGLRLRWTRATCAAAAELCRQGRPVVGRTPEGAFVILRRDGRGHLEAAVVPGLLGPRSVRGGTLAAELVGTDPESLLVWALAEPALPASPVLPSTEGGPRPSPIARLRALLKVEKPDIQAVILYAVVIGVLSLATPLAMQVLINWLAFGSLQQPVVVLAIVLLVFLGLAAGLRSVQRLAVEMIQRRIFVRMVSDLATRLSRVRVEAFDRRHGPELLNRFFDVLTVQKSLAALLLDGVAAVLQALVGLVLLGLYHPVLLVFDAVLVVAVAAILGGLGRGAQATAIRESRTKYAVASWMEELARHPVLFKLSGGETLAVGRAELLAREYLEARDAHWRVYFRQFIGIASLQAAAAVALLGICGALVLRGELTIGQLVAAEFIVTSSLAAVGKLTGKLDSFYDLLAGIDKLGTLVDLPQERPHGLPLRGHGPASVSVEELECGPADSPPRDLELPAGSRCAVLSAPGVGKSALADVILGLRSPRAGRVLRDGVDLAELRPAEVFGEALLLRGAEVVAGTLLENLTHGRPELGHLHAHRALARVGLTRRVAALPEGLDTLLAPTGAPLTPSEVQRLAVARALLARPRLLVVDGLLDALPDLDRHELLHLLSDPAQPWTLVVFTERPEVAEALPQRLHLTSENLHVLR